MDRIELRKVYNAYGFKEECSVEEGVAIFSIKAGHYHNADIVVINHSSNVEKIFKEYTNLGYACQIKRYKNIKEVSLELFEGFFNISTTKSRFMRDYKSFTDSIVKIHSDEAEYNFIQTKYIVNDKAGELDVISEITEKLSENKPMLFLIEAAAGFGKTCTAYELLKKIIDDHSDKVPIFSELSRNRQAKIFRYVLLDEIDRSFPLLSSTLVKSEIKSGRVPLILDGFDELLHESNEESEKKYESTEPMLETISELLVNQAKVILTTRRTAIFDGDEFHKWISDHENDFDVIRIRLNEPRVEDWLPEDRYNTLTQLKFPIQSLSNPVLLSFLRCISLSEFERVIEKPSDLVEKYFSSMLERERKRQDLQLTVEQQYKILTSICEDMILYDYTSESREYICSVILDKHQVEIEKARKLYSSDVRPTTDEIVNKLASHALLDRGSKDAQGIGFVNEFVFGNFCAENIVSDTSMEWIGDNRFIEPAVNSYIPRVNYDKEILWESLKFALEFMDGRNKLRYNYYLINEMPMDLVGESIDSLSLNGVSIGEKGKVSDTIFIDCKFTNVSYYLSGFENVSFLNCVFYSCKVIGEIHDVYFLGCESDNSLFEEESQSEIEINNDYNDADIYVLERFYPKGSSTFHKHRAIGAICTKNNRFGHREILDSIKKLKRKEFLIVPDKPSFLELNIEKITEIKKALGRD